MYCQRCKIDVSKAGDALFKKRIGRYDSFDARYIFKIYGTKVGVSTTSEKRIRFKFDENGCCGRFVIAVEDSWSESETTEVVSLQNKFWSELALAWILRWLR